MWTLNGLWFRFICPWWRSICISNTFYSLKVPGVKFFSSPWPCSWNMTNTSNRATLPPDKTSAHKPSSPQHGHCWPDWRGRMCGAELTALPLPDPRGSIIATLPSHFFLSYLPTTVFSALELHPVPQVWKKKGLICCPSCRLQYIHILGHPWRQNDICMLNAVEQEHNALKPLRKSTGQLIWFKPMFKFYETHFQG